MSGTPGESALAAVLDPGPAIRAPNAWLLVAVVGTFWPVLFGAYLADDLRLLLHNPAIEAGDVRALLLEPMFGAQGGYWRPATMLAMYCGHTLGGAFGMHLLSLSLHGINTLAVHALARRLVAPSPAFWVALVFAVHPVQVESVAWCAAINDPLWVAAALQALLATLRWLPARRWGLPWAAMGWVLLASAAKEPGVVAAVLTVVAATIGPGARPASARVWLWVAVAMVGTTLVWFVARAVVHGEWVGQVMAGASVDPFTAFAPLRAAHLLLAQLALLPWPWPSLLMRSVAPSPTAEWLAAVVVALAVLSAVAWWRRVPPFVRFAAALVLVPLLPVVVYGRVIGVYPIADRYLYLPVVGFALLLGGSLRCARGRWLPWAVPGVFAAASFVATWNWHDSAHLVAHSIVHAPDDPMVQAMAGDLALDRAFAGDYPAILAAKDHYERVVALVDPGRLDEQRRRSLGTARLGLAWCRLLRREGDASQDEAILAAFRTAVDVGAENAMAWVGLAAANLQLRRFDAAEAAFTEALRRDPKCKPAQSGLQRVREQRAAGGR